MHWTSRVVILVMLTAHQSHQLPTDQQQQPELYQQPPDAVEVASYAQEQQQISPNSINTAGVLYPEINQAEDMPVPLPDPVVYQNKMQPQQSYPQPQPQQNYPNNNMQQGGYQNMQPGGGLYPTGMQGSYPQPQQMMYQQQAPTGGYAPGYDPVSLAQNAFAYETVQNANLYLQNNNPPPNHMYRPIPYNSGPIAFPAGAIPYHGGPGTGMGGAGSPMMDPQPMGSSDDDDDAEDGEHQHGSGGGGLLARLRGLVGGMMGGGSSDDSAESSGGDGGGGGGGAGGALSAVTGLIGGLLGGGGGGSSLDGEDGGSGSPGILPVGTKLTFNNDLSIPMPSPLEQIKITIPFAYNYRGNGLFAPTSSRKRRSLHDDQFNIFKTIEHALANIGIDGKACVLRAICEVNEKPLRGINMIGEIATIILSPKSKGDGTDFLDEYVVARKTGRSKGGCWKRYTKCPFSIAGFVQGLELEHNTTT